MTQTSKQAKYTFAEVKEFDDNELVAVASTPDLDRDSEIIAAEGWRLDNFRANPVILATHMHRLFTGSSPVIGSAPSIETTDDGLVFRMRFAGTELGREYEGLYRDRHMRAFSVGFIPINGEWRDFNRDGKAKRVWVHTEVELLEISAVPVPANPEALARIRELAAAGPLDAGAMAKVITDEMRKISPDAAALTKADFDDFVTDIQTQIEGHFRELRTAVFDRLDDLQALLPDDVNPGGRAETDAPDRAGETGAARETGDGADEASKGASRAAARRLAEAARKTSQTPN